MNEANGACNNLKKSHFNSRLGSMGTRVLANVLLGSNPVLIQDPFSGGEGILPPLIYIDNQVPPFSCTQVLLAKINRQPW